MNVNSDKGGTSPEESPSRGARRRAHTRAKLLAAARQVFAAQGYHDTNISEITSVADVGVGTFYLHFRDKEEVLRVLLEEGFGALRERTAAALASVPPRYVIPVLIHTIFRFAYEDREIFSIALSDGGMVGLALQARANLAETFTLVLEAASARRLLVGYDVPLLARLLTGVVAQGIMWWLEEDEPDPEGMTEQVLRLLRDGLPAELLTEDDSVTS